MKLFDTYKFRCNGENAALKRMRIASINTIHLPSTKEICLFVFRL